MTAKLPELIDIGANLTHDSFDRDRAQVIDAAMNVGVRQLVVTGASITGSHAACELATKYPGTLYATAGIHPHHAKDWSTDTEAALHDIARQDGVVAAGECGLDYFRNFSSPAQQHHAFERQLEMAAALNLPVFLHQRDALDDFLAILDPFLDHIPRAVAHCFTDARQELYKLLDRDLYIGITGWICDERRGHHLRDVVGEIPAHRLMVETDAPYLLPRDLTPQPKSRRNEPKYLPHIATEIARHCDQSFVELAHSTTANAREFFAIPTP
ncbi:MAG: hydrolase TatD [Gammaproteobacteria bacterium]|nr:hydrolase TatD [Gammaproteobacteria bacterium]